MTVRFQRWVLLPVMLLSITGCSSVYSLLTPQQKRDVYEQVAEEVKTHMERGMFLEKTGYLHEALQEYERARFYGGLAPVNPEAMEILKTQIARESQEAYSRGQQALKQKDYAKALQEFNAVMRLNPDFADVQRYYWRMLNKSENIIRIDELASRLEALLESPGEGPKKYRETDQVTHDLLAYQYDHPVAYAQHMHEFDAYLDERKKGLAFIRQGYHALLSKNFIEAENAFKQARRLKSTTQEGVAGLYRLQKRKDAIYLTTLANNSLNRGNLPQAEERARKAVDSDKEYAPATILLKKIIRQRLVTESGDIIIQARKALAEGEYLSAMASMEEILQSEPEHDQAQALYQEARNKLKESIPSYIKEGKVLFNNNHYDEAASLFSAVLVVEPDNNISKTYLSRIEQRKRTVQMLNQ